MLCYACQTILKILRFFRLWFKSTTFIIMADGVHIEFVSAWGRILHPVDNESSNQMQLEFSSIGGKLMTSATSTGRRSLIAERYFVPNLLKFKQPFVLPTNSKVTYSVVSPL